MRTYKKLLFLLSILLVQSCGPQSTAEPRSTLPPVVIQTINPSPSLSSNVPSSTYTVPASTATWTLTTAPTTTRLPTKTLTPTPPPTLTSAELVQADQEIKQLLQNDEVCVPPCFLGVVPGQTTLVELKSIFLQWGIPLKNGSDKSYSFNYHHNNSYNLHVVFTLKDDFVNATSVNFYQDEPYQWALYSPSALLKRLGVPSSVEFWIGEIHDWPNPTPLKGWYFMLIRYADLDMVVEYNPVEIQQGLIVVCPNQDYYGGGRIWLGEHSISNKTSLEDATSITLQKFYDFILSGPGACFYLDTNKVAHG